MTLPTIRQAPGRPRLRRLLWRLGLFFGIGVVFIGGGMLWEWSAGSAELRKAVAETDAQSPGWRLADVEAARPALPPGEDSAVVLAGLAANSPEEAASPGKLPEPWPGQDAPKLYGVTPGELPPNVRLTAEQRAELKAVVAKKADALTAARSLADLPRGRHPYELTPDILSTQLPYAQPCRGVARLLEYGAILDADAGVGDPLRDCRAILNTGRSFDGEPFAITALLRVSLCRVGTLTAERVLAQSEPPEAALAALQALCEREGAADLMGVMVRGERAGFDQLFTNLESGRLPLDEFLAKLSNSQPSFWVWLNSPFSRSKLPRDHAAVLRQMNEWEKIARLPEHEQSAAMAEWAAAFRADKNLPVFTRMLFPALDKGLRATVRHKAHMRTAAVALACERFRRANGRWPDALADLTPAFLAAVPADPYDGRPLRLRRSPDGLLVYSVGPDGADNEGTLDPKKPERDGADLGFRLFDVAARRAAGNPGGPGR